MPYEHTQHGWPVRIAFGLAALGLLAMPAVQLTAMGLFPRNRGLASSMIGFISMVKPPAAAASINAATSPASSSGRYGRANAISRR